MCVRNMNTKERCVVHNVATKINDHQTGSERAHKRDEHEEIGEEEWTGEEGSTMMIVVMCCCEVL